MSDSPAAATGEPVVSAAKKLDSNLNLEKMRVKELRHLMQEHEVECPNCLEKSDMIKRIRETILKPDKKEL